MKKIIFILLVIGVIVLPIIISSKINKTTDKNDKPSLSSPTTTEQPIIAVTDKEREIFYKYDENYRQILHTAQTIDKSLHNNAISLTAEQFQISTEEAEQIVDKVTKARPTTKEIEIYETLETKLDEAIDNTPPGKSTDEEAVNTELAKKYGISIPKLKAIYVLVLSNTEYQEQRKGKVAQDLQKNKQNNLVENRKKILQDYIKKIDDTGMNQFLESVSYKYSSTDECSIVIKVRDTWHYQIKQTRLQAAQNLWSLWSQGYYLEDTKDKCRMDLVDLNGNNVGGSSWMGGSVVNVKD